MNSHACWFFFFCLIDFGGIGKFLRTGSLPFKPHPPGSLYLQDKPWREICFLQVGSSSLDLLCRFFFLLLLWRCFNLAFSMSCNVLVTFLRLQQQSVSRFSERVAYHPAPAVPGSLWGGHSSPGVHCRGKPTCTVWVVPQQSAHATTKDELAQGK